MLPEPITFVLLVAFGGWVATDATTVGQFMISRPFVAAALAGAIAGAPTQGAMLGVLLEALQLNILPVGAARYPEAGPPAVAAAAVYAAAPPTGAALLTAVVFALAWERLSGDSVQLIRRLDRRLLVAGGKTTMTPDLLQRRHFLAIGLDWLRGAVIVGLGIVVLSLVLPLVDVLWTWGESFPRYLIMGAFAASLGAAVRLFGGRERVPLLLAGAALGLLLLVVR